MDIYPKNIQKYSDLWIAIIMFLHHKAASNAALTIVLQRYYCIYILAKTLLVQWHS
jgi:hypothetical protein